MNTLFFKVSLQWLSVLGLVIFSTVASVSGKHPNLLRLRVRGQTLHGEPANLSELDSEEFQTFYYNQTLDHFNYRPESYTTFPQRYVVNFKYWGGANASAPIFAYLGEESDLSNEWLSVGFFVDNAARFKALLVYIEHRYYGKSIPFGSRKEAFKDASTLGYFNSAQAIADYAEVILHLKKKLLAENSPVIVFGGSYGGMLASWFRLKYPHVALGALASSAPILYFDDIIPENGYNSIATKNFREVSESCYTTISESWSEIDRVASEPNGLSILSKKFKLCKELNNSDELKDFLERTYDIAAQYDEPPSYPVTMVCRGIDGGPEGNDTLSRVFAGVVALRGNFSCYNTSNTDFSLETLEGWGWQTCSEMVIPLGRGDETMFPPNPFDLSAYSRMCENLYGVRPRPHWVTTYYGGHNIELILRRFGSNIIFSNGLRDPYSSGGVLKNISQTVLAIHTANGSHCLDLRPAKSTDPDWLVMQRKAEVEIIESWIAQYYADLQAIKK